MTNVDILVAADVQVTKRLDETVSHANHTPTNSA